ncbi:MAG: pitrilysin family protein [Planctomycetota bacterium]
MVLDLPPARDGDPIVVTFDNGFRLVLVRNGASPMTASVVAVRTGLREETGATNGVSHMLEHLLFNGTETRTQAELYEAADRLGMYNNANTGNDCTNFMILVENDGFAAGLEIQADMLFHSTLPADQIPKEKQIVIEEMLKDRAMAGDEDPAVQRENVLRGTPYAREVIGSEASVTALTREQILEHYRAHYVPSNMTALVSGRFEPAAMVELYRRHFGQGERRAAPASGTVASPLARAAVAEGKTRKPQNVIVLSFPAPGANSPDRVAFSVLASLLAGKNSPLARALDALGGEVACSYEFNRDFGTFEVRCEVDPLAPEGMVVDAVEAALQSVTGSAFDAAALAREQLGRRMAETTLLEQPHYLGLMKAPLLANLSTERLATVCGAPFLAEVAAITADRLCDLVRSQLAHCQPALTIYRSEAAPATSPGTVVWSTADATLTRYTLACGVTLLVSHDRSARTFAAHVLVGNRSLVEPAGKEGIADLLHRLLQKGTVRCDAKQLAEELADIGAELKCVDDRSIPYDDYQTSPRFSYVRLQALDEQFLRAIAILAELLSSPRFAADDFERARGEMRRIVEAETKSSQARAMCAFGAAVLPESGAGASVYGSLASLSAITLEDVKAFHARYFVPVNLIVAVATSMPPDVVARALDKSLGSLPRGPRPQPHELPQASPPLDGGAERAFVIVGKRIVVPPADRPALRILNAMLSQRASFELRERQGLAYSIGARVWFAGEALAFALTMGTRADNASRAQAGLHAEIERFVTQPPDQRELERACAETVRQKLMGELTRMSRAYAISVAAFEGEAQMPVEESVQQLKSVTLEDVLRVHRACLLPGAWTSIAAR